MIKFIARTLLEQFADVKMNLCSPIVAFDLANEHRPRLTNHRGHAHPVSQSVSEQIWWT